MPLPLVERSEKEIARMIKKRVDAVKDVRGSHNISVRMPGKRYDVDMHLLLDSNLRFEEVHRIASEVERAVKEVLPKARVTVHTEPLGASKHDLGTIVKEIAEKVPGSRGVHDVHIQRIAGKLCLDLHLEVSANSTLKHAHDISDEVERMLKAADLNLSEITIHIETASDLISRELKGDENELRWYIEHAAEHFPQIKAISEVEMRKIGDKMHVVIQCLFERNIAMKEAHEVSSNLEKMIKDAFPEVDRVDIHQEPA